MKLFAILSLTLVAFLSVDAIADANGHLKLFNRSASCGGAARVVRERHVVRERLVRPRAACGAAVTRTACGGSGAVQAEKIMPKKQ